MIQRTTFATCLLIVSLSDLVASAQDVSRTIHPDRVLNDVATKSQLTCRKAQLSATRLSCG